MNAALTLVIGNRNYSSWSLRPWILAQHLGLELAIRRIALDTPTFHTQALAASPTGRVPVLLHGSLALPESIAIIEYLSELSNGRGWPTDRDRRAQARALAAEMHGGFGALRSICPMNIRARGRIVTVTPALRQEIERVDAIFSAAGDRWLFGEYSGADAMFLPVAFRFWTYGAMGLSATAQAYVRRATDDPLVQSWIQSACAEAESIDHEEVGL